MWTADGIDGWSDGCTDDYLSGPLTYDHISTNIVDPDQAVLTKALCFGFTPFAEVLKSVSMR